MRTGLRDSALRRVRSVAAGQCGVPGLAEAPAWEGTARGGAEGRGVPWEEVSPWDGRASPGRLPRVPWAPAPYLPATCQGFDGRPSTHFFSSSVCKSQRARRAGRQPLLAQPGPPHPFLSQGTNPPTQGRTILAGCSVLSAAFPSLVGFGGQEWDAIMLHCGTTRGSSRYVPDLLLQPCLSCSSVQGGGEGEGRHGAGGTSPAFPRPTLPSVPMIWFNLFCFLS